MGWRLNKREPKNTTRIHQNPKVKDILENSCYEGFFEKLRGYDDEISLEFSLNLQCPKGHEIVIEFKVLIIYLDEYLIIRVTTNSSWCSIEYLFSSCLCQF